MREGLLSCEIASCKSNEKLVLRLPIKKPALRKSEVRDEERERILINIVCVSGFYHPLS